MISAITRRSMTNDEYHQLHQLHQLQESRRMESQNENESIDIPTRFCARFKLRATQIHVEKGELWKMKMKKREKEKKKLKMR